MTAFWFQAEYFDVVCLDLLGASFEENLPNLYKLIHIP
jgi:hypothetical protein